MALPRKKPAKSTMAELDKGSLRHSRLVPVSVVASVEQSFQDKQKILQNKNGNAARLYLFPILVSVSQDHVRFAALTMAQTELSCSQDTSFATNALTGRRTG